MRVRLIDPASPEWEEALSDLYGLAGGPDNQTLFPYHFLQAALPRIGGHVAVVEDDHSKLAVIFLFPRLTSSLAARGQPAYTLRLHPLSGCAPVEMGAVAQQLSEWMAAPVTPYDPLGDLHFEPSYEWVQGVDIGRPDRTEAASVRTLQQEVWGSPPAALYPADIHSIEFGLGTSLVARVEGQQAGFLFGFVKFGGYTLPADWQERFTGDLRIESQALGVLPAFRGARIGFLLKKVQAERALATGIQIINWTVDPLQWPNAVLNFGRLRAIAFDFTPDYYPFRNELNRVAASRFGITWLAGSARVRQALELPEQSTHSPSAPILDLGQESDIVRVNNQWRLLTATPASETIAIEIPADWTALQRHDLDTATRWRATTDQLFQQLIGHEPGQYVITDVGTDGARRYLIGQRVDGRLWSELGSLPGEP
jgi:predicted GNAT superfamily acetyltransferase